MTRKMIFEFLTNMRNTVLLFILILGLSGCEFFALSFAPGKKPLENNSELANQASKVFWETLHQGDYSNISKPYSRACPQSHLGPYSFIKLRWQNMINFK